MMTGNALTAECRLIQTVRVLSGFSFFVEGARVNVRAKGRAVNSVFLVQLRKMIAGDCDG